MISYGWRLIGSGQDVGISASGIDAFQTDYISSGNPKLIVDGYSYISIALLHTNTASANAKADIYGVNFTGESSQSDVEKNAAINQKICTIQGAAAAIPCPANTIPGVDVDTEWGIASVLTDVASSGDGEMLGLMSSYAGFKGSELVQTGTANNVFGSVVTNAYHTVTGGSVIPGSITIPCSMFAALQFDLYSTVATDDVYVIGCAFG